jgi:hypothetical protein
MNKHHIKKGINLLEVESSIIGKTNNKHDIAKEQAKLLDELSKDLNLDISNLVDSDESEEEESDKEPIRERRIKEEPKREYTRESVRDSDESESSSDESSDFRSKGGKEEQVIQKKKYSADDIKETLNKLDFEEEYRDETLVIPKMRADKYSDEKFTNSELTDLDSPQNQEFDKDIEQNLKMSNIQELNNLPPELVRQQIMQQQMTQGDGMMNRGMMNQGMMNHGMMNQGMDPSVYMGPTPMTTNLQKNMNQLQSAQPTCGGIRPPRSMYEPMANNTYSDNFMDF